jgi:hypothetical protein
MSQQTASSAPIITVRPAVRQSGRQAGGRFVFVCVEAGWLAGVGAPTCSCCPAVASRTSASSQALTMVSSPPVTSTAPLSLKARQVTACRSVCGREEVSKGTGTCRQGQAALAMCV